MARLTLSGFRILVVDDELFSRNILARLLDHMGRPEIHTAENGSEALEKIKAIENLNFIISDFKMPLFDGLLLLQYIRSGEAQIDRAGSDRSFGRYLSHPYTQGGSFGFECIRWQAKDRRHSRGASLIPRRERRSGATSNVILRLR